MLASGEELGYGTARRCAKDRERTVLWSDNRRLQIDTHVIGASGCHQRELVQRQRPSDAAGRNKRQLVDEIALDILDQPVHRLVEIAVVDRQGVLVALADVRAKREEERVVLDRLVGLRVDRLPDRIDPAKFAVQQRCAGIAHDRGEWIAAGRTLGERLADDHRPVHELGVGSYHRHIGPVVPKIG